jgi:hypothetical protein
MGVEQSLITGFNVNCTMYTRLFNGKGRQEEKSSAIGLTRAVYKFKQPTTAYIKPHPKQDSSEIHILAGIL